MNLLQRLDELMRALKIPKGNECIDCKFCVSSYDFDKNIKSCLIFEKSIINYNKPKECIRIFGRNGHS